MNSPKKKVRDIIIIHIILHFITLLVQAKSRLVWGAHSGVTEDCDVVSLGV